MRPVRPTRIALAVLVVALVAGALIGCARGPVAGASASTVGAATSAASPTSTAAPDTTAVHDIEDDLNSSDVATSNANGDVVDADNAAASNDSP